MYCVTIDHNNDLAVNGSCCWELPVPMGSIAYILVQYVANLYLLQKCNQFGGCSCDVGYAGIDCSLNTTQQPVCSFLCV